MYKAEAQHKNSAFPSVTQRTRQAASPGSHTSAAKKAGQLQNAAILPFPETHCPLLSFILYLVQQKRRAAPKSRPPTIQATLLKKMLQTITEQPLLPRSA